MIEAKSLIPNKLHWIHRYLSVPYLPGGRTWQGVDCWGLLCLAYHEEYHITLPVLPELRVEDTVACAHAIQKERGQNWTEILKPIDGCGVGLSQVGILHHVGIYAAADGGKVIHCQGSNRYVVADTIRHLRAQGFLVIKFYRHNLWPT